MNYQQTLDYIYNFLDFEKDPRSRAAAKYDLRRVYDVLERLGNPQNKVHAVHVAGTKGKGSTAAMIASALTASGYKTGLYISPHLIDIRERFRIDGQLITEQELIDITAKIQPHIEAENETATWGKLTTFEVMTVLTFTYFAEKGADFMVIEVGLGGRLDATNVIKPEVSVITSISFDHMEVLGDTLPLIATEKGGIIKPGGVTVLSPQGEEVTKTIEKICEERNARLIKVDAKGKGNVSFSGLGYNLNEQALKVKGRLGNYDLSIPLLGQHQLSNAATAVAALEVLKEKGYTITAESITQGLKQVKWPGRLQIMNRKPIVVVDGAHNVDSFQKLKLALSHYFQYEKSILIMGVSFDKQIPDLVGEIAPAFDKVFATRSWHPRAMKPELLAAEFAKHGKQAEITESVTDAITKALAVAGPNDLICVTGSLFVVGEVLEQAAKLKLKP